MTPSRVYSVEKIRKHPLRQEVLSDRNLTIVAIAILSVGLWYVGRKLPMQVKVFGNVIGAGIIYLLYSTKIDGQPLLRVLLRAVSFVLRKKNIRF